jgi:glycosyltransferase involved in cell wall biosynthesis
LLAKGSAALSGIGVKAISTLAEAARSLEQLGFSSDRPLKVAWFSYFPIEWQTRIPEELRTLPKRHPATWQTVLLEQFENKSFLDLHVLMVRPEFPRTFAFKRNNLTFHCLKSPPGARLASLYWVDTVLTSGVLHRLQPDIGHGWGSEFGGASVASRLPFRTVVTMQGILTWLRTVYPLNKYQKVSAFLEKRALARLRYVTCESNFAMQFLKQQWPHLNLMQVEHAPNPIFAQVTRTPQLSPPKIVCVSSFNYAKGADVLMGALEKLKSKLQFDVLFIGNRGGDFESQLRTRISPDIWDRCTWKDNLSPEQVAQELAKATFVVYPTRADNSPNAVKEAVVAGVPVIASRVGGIVDYVWPDKNGFLFEVGNVSGCAEAIEKANRHSLFGRGLVDTGSLAGARNYLSSETMAAGMLQAYANVLRQ